MCSRVLHIPDDTSFHSRVPPSAFCSSCQPRASTSAALASLPSCRSLNSSVSGLGPFSLDLMGEEPPTPPPGRRDTKRQSTFLPQAPGSLSPHLTERQSSVHVICMEVTGERAAGPVWPALHEPWGVIWQLFGSGCGTILCLLFSALGLWPTFQANRKSPKPHPVLLILGGFPKCF